MNPYKNPPPDEHFPAHDAESHTAAIEACLETLSNVLYLAYNAETLAAAKGSIEQAQAQLAELTRMLT